MEVKGSGEETEGTTWRGREVGVPGRDGRARWEGGREGEGEGGIVAGIHLGEKRDRFLCGNNDSVGAARTKWLTTCANLDLTEHGTT